MLKPWSSLQDKDPDVYRLIEAELARQCEGLELIASENFASQYVISAAGNILTNKYAEGLPGKRYYGGCEEVDRMETLAIERAKKLFGAQFANVQPHSGAQANAAVLLALAPPGSTILGMDLSHGGHLTHGSPVNFSGIYYRPTFYGVDPETELLDYDQIREIARREKPKLIVAGASAYPRAIDFAVFREIADEVGAYFMVDMAHIAGLVATGLHANPLEHAHVVTTTTHKTLRGPRGGLVLWNEADLTPKLNKGVFPGTQGGPLEHIIAAKAVSFLEAMAPEFKAYQLQVVRNASELADGLIDEGFRVVSGGTDNHLVLLSLLGREVSGKQLEEALGRVAITVNKNTVPREDRSPFVTSGVRLGSPAVTTRGLKEADMRKIAGWISATFKHINDEAGLLKIRQEVQALAKRFPLYPGWEA